jgi:autophagy-related protein 2
LRNAQGWSTASQDDSDNEDEFLPMRVPGATSMNNSMSSNNASMDGSLFGSSVSSKNSSSNGPRQQKYRHSIDADASAETSQFHVRVSSVAMILLHEDILTIGIEAYGPTRASTEIMKTTADNFFTKLGVLGVGGYGNKDFERVSKFFADACQQSHLRQVSTRPILLVFISTAPKDETVARPVSLTRSPVISIYQ